MRALSFPFLLMLFIAGCASLPPNPVSLQTRDTLFIETVDVVWGIDDNAKKLEEASEASAEKYIERRDAIIANLKTAVTTEFKDSPSGAEPALLEIEIVHYVRRDALASNFIGLTNELIGNVTLKRASTGEVLGVYEGVRGYYAPSSGILGAMVEAAARPDIGAILVGSFTKDLRRHFDSE